MKTASVIKLHPEIKEQLSKIANSRTNPGGLILRAKIILLASEGWDNQAIAYKMGCSTRIVTKWRCRFKANPSIDSLKDIPGRGRKPTIPALAKCEVVKLACSPLPSKYVEQGETRWTLKLIKKELKEVDHIQISKSEIHRILQDKQIKPHKVRMWMHSSDPEFKKKFKEL